MSGHFVGSAAFISHPGAVRTVNEDSYLDASDVGLWGVADGMGGHEGGDIASQMVVDSLSTLSSGAPVVDQVSERLAETNRALRDLSVQRYRNQTIGATVALFLLDGANGICVWAGDSRIYLYRDGSLRQLTRDHSQVEELISKGVLAREQAKDHPLAHVVTRAVGADDDLRLETCAEPLRDGDLILLCSDGLNDAVPEAEIGDLLGEGDGDCAHIAAELLNLALECQARDNVTVGLVRFRAVD